MQALILAGGKGTRLAERLAGRPKPLIDVCGVPLLERQIRALEAHGVNEVIVLVNHAADQIHAFFAARDFNAIIRVVDDGDPRGTAGAVLACLDSIEERTLIVYGDTMFDIDIKEMVAAHMASGAAATLLLHPNDHPMDSDLVAIDSGGYVTAFHPHPHPPGADLRNLVNAAFYVVEKNALTRWCGAPVPSDFGHDLFPAMLAAGQRLFGYVSAEYIKDLGTPARLDKVERHLAAGLVTGASRRVMQRAVFLDRDGTLNQLSGHIATPDEIVLVAGADTAVRRLNDAGLRTILVTNQPVIARGDCDFTTLDRIHGRLETLLSVSGGYLDRLFFCPHHPDSGYAGEVSKLKIACDCRKPGTGMFERAIETLKIDRNRSWMVGDSSADMLAANRAGLLSILVQTGEGGRDGKFAGVADLIVRDVVAAVDFIVDRYPALACAVAVNLAPVKPGDIVLVDAMRTPSLAAIVRSELRAARHNAEIIPAVPASSAEVPDPQAVSILEWPAAMPAPATHHTTHRLVLARDFERPVS